MAGVVLLLVRQAGYGLDLRSNQFGGTLILYYVPAVVMYGGVLLRPIGRMPRGKWRGKDARFR